MILWKKENKIDGSIGIFVYKDVYFDASPGDKGRMGPSDYRVSNISIYVLSNDEQGFEESIKYFRKREENNA